jgi:hypothetical protein
MAALPAPMPALVLNARVNGVTFLTQEGNGFNSTSTVTLEDQNATVADRYTFACLVVQDTPKRLLVQVTCTAVGAHPAQFAKARVTVTTGATVDDSGNIPVRLSTRLEPVLHQTHLPPARLRVKLNAKSAVVIPGVGFGDLNELVPCELLVPPLRGTWSVVRARQLAKKVKVTLLCTGEGTPGEGGGATTGTLTVTLSPRNETTVTAPPVPVEYVDPDDDPEP